MSDVSEFLGAMQMLQRGMQDVAQTKLISQATADMKLANQNIKDDQERFLALQNMSNELALRLSGAGADPTKVAQTAKAIAPQFGTADEAIFQGTMSGSEQLLKLGQRAKRASNADELALRTRALDLQQMELGLKLKSAAAEGFDPTKFNSDEITNLEALPEKVRSRVIPGVGVAADDKDAPKLRKYFADSRSSMDILNQIEQISATGNRLGPQTKSRLNQKLNMLVGRMREQVVGGGVMSEQDFERVMETLPDLTSWTDKMTGSQQAKLKDLKSLLQRADGTMAESSGITFFKDKAPGAAGAGTSQMDAIAEMIRKENPNSPLLKQYELLKALKSQGAQ